jgi:hypothetical protein
MIVLFAKPIVDTARKMSYEFWRNTARGMTEPKPYCPSALLQLSFKARRISSPSIAPATEGLEVHRTIQLDPNLKL